MENTLFPNIPIKNYSIDNKNNLPPSCQVCGMSLNKMPYTCPLCNRVVGYNCHSDILLPMYIRNQVWKKPFENKRVCTVCIDEARRISQAADNKAKLIFAQVFSTDNDDNVDLDNISNVEETTPQETVPENIDEIENQFIGGVLDSLAAHDNLDFDKSGKLSPLSWNKIIHSLKEYLRYPDFT
jgi:hypothetical protein